MEQKLYGERGGINEPPNDNVLSEKGAVILQELLYRPGFLVMGCVNI